MQAYLIALGKFGFLDNESYKETIDRFKKLISDVRALPPVQVPDDVSLMGILKEAIFVQKKQHLWSHLEYTPNINLETMIDVISRWCNMGTNFLPTIKL